MKKKGSIFIIRILILSACIFPLLSINTYASIKNVNIVYFYITVCEQCNEAHKEMINISKELSDYKPNIIMYNIENTDNLKLLNQYYDYYKIPQNQRHLPCAFIGKTYLKNEEEIHTGLKKSIINMDSETPILKKDNIKKTYNKLDLAGSFFTGLVNGFNPCALSMLLLFMSLLMAQNTHIIKTGFAFILGKFLMFLALGTVLYNFLSAININVYTGVVKILVLILILFVTIANIADFLSAKNEKYGNIHMQLPAILRKKLDLFIKHMTKSIAGRYMVLISFITGCVIAIGEFLCTGQLYLAAIINGIREYGNFNSYAFLSLAIYALGFILPLFILVLAIHRGKLIFELSDSLLDKLPVIKLVTAAAFLIYGLIFLLFL